MMRWISVFVFLVGMVASVDAAVLCTAKSGQGAIRVRESCLKNEKLLDPVTVGLRGPGAVVKDANGALVGVVAQVNSWTYVVRQVGAIGVFFRVKESGWLEEGLTIEHASADCSDAGFFSYPNDYLLVKSGLIRGTTGFFSSAPATMATLASTSHSPVQQTDCPNSSLRFFIPPDICCEKTGPISALRYPAQTIDLSHLVPPFHVEVQE